MWAGRGILNVPAFQDVKFQSHTVKNIPTKWKSSTQIGSNLNEATSLSAGFPVQLLQTGLTGQISVIL